MNLPPITKNTSIKDGIKELGIFEKGNDAWVSSRDVAKLFDKEHKDILAAIKEQILPNVTEDFAQRNFPLSKYKDKTGKSNPEFLLNRDSASMLIMGFTGKKAMQFKEAYITAFNTMLTLIETRLLSKAGYKEMTSAIARKYGSDPRKFSIEADMINELVLGMKAKDFKATNQIDENGHTRDSVVQDKLDKLDKAQRLNAQLITAGMDYDRRVSIINSNFGRE